MARERRSQPSGFPIFVGRTRERPRRVGEHEQRCDDGVHAVDKLQAVGSQTALYNESAG